VTLHRYGSVRDEEDFSTESSCCWTVGKDVSFWSRVCW